MAGRAVTRINIGVSPTDLCDQHLIAEYRELPRMATYSRGVPAYDMPFTLGRGHMRSCVRYGSHLVARHYDLVVEMFFRGFKPSYGPVRADLFAYLDKPSPEWIISAAFQVRERIRDRLRTMKREPVWTHRTRPQWTIP